MYEPIFIKENEKNIFGVLEEQGLDVSAFQHYFVDLFKRLYNNQVGYYIVKQDKKVYKFIVLPKTIQEGKEAEKEFVNYLLHYYRVNNIYGFDQERKIPDSLLQLLFESNNNQKSSHDRLKEFEFQKQKAILLAIEDFFKRHRNSKRIRVDYTSQSVKHKLDLKQNIKELDKTKIHQSKNKEVVYSLMATVAYGTLKLFVNYLDEEEQNELVVEVKRIKNFLLKKYSVDRGFKMNYYTLQGLKVAKIFNKRVEHKQLLINLKSLFGFEQMYQDTQQHVEYRDDLKTTSLFIDPIKFYEWFVYDILKKYADANGKSIEFDKNERTATYYYLNEQQKSSNPDYILTDEANKIKIVIDAKWKNVNEFGDIKPSDYLKLKFDAFLLEKKGFGVISYLVYPNINIGKKKFNMILDNSSIFEFNTLEMDMEFEKYGNSLDFDFNLTELKSDIEKNSNIEQLKSIAEELSDKISTYRDSILYRLIEEEDDEKRELLKIQLDKKLQELGLELYNELDEQELLPEIAEILENYSDVLEEESKKFLISSSVIYSYYKDKKYEHFDYSMPGSGFWKLIELELNTSLVWDIRIMNNVCNGDCPWTPIGRGRRTIFYEINPRKKVRLNQYEQNSTTRLQGIMLGGIKILLGEDDILDEFDIKYRNFLEVELPFALEKIIDLRNRHAHIKAMPLDKFEELWGVLFGEDEGEINVVKKLLEFKKSFNEGRE